MNHREGWILERSESLSWIRHRLFEQVPGVGHAFSTRVDGGGRFDMGPAAPLAAEHEQRRRQLLLAAGIAAARVEAPHQVHGAHLIEPGSGAPREADGVIVRRGDPAGRAAAIRTADCLPVLLAADDGSAVAAVHAGWRGTAAGIVTVAVGKFLEHGVGPERLLAVLGPCIGACCYQVGGEVVDAVAGAGESDVAAVSRPDGADRFRLDLALANARQLERAGVHPGRVVRAPWCTRCREDLFFSYRREGAAAGRMMACIGWVERSP